ncbi:hypothetical protein [Halomicrobium zhouii]|uniref:hypothetical protein n=1 Tax=Halomicrobium zhouii TaxID=767519 RepID=UPI001160DB2E|nr:hypothetical protein [Halomicrobium zhouii]
MQSTHLDRDKQPVTHVENLVVGDGRVRRDAMIALVTAVEERPEDVLPWLPDLLRIVENGDLQGREEAAIVLGKVAESQPHEIEPLANRLVDVLDSADERVQEQIVCILTNVHVESLPVDSLIEIFESAQTDACAATSILGNVARQAPDLMPSERVRRAAVEDSPELRARALYLLFILKAMDHGDSEIGHDEFEELLTAYSSETLDRWIRDSIGRQYIQLLGDRNHPRENHRRLSVSRLPNELRINVEFADPELFDVSTVKNQLSAEFAAEEVTIDVFKVTEESQRSTDGHKQEGSIATGGDQSEQEKNDSPQSSQSSSSNLDSTDRASSPEQTQDALQANSSDDSVSDAPADSEAENVSQRAQESIDSLLEETFSGIDEEDSDS